MRSKDLFSFFYPHILPKSQKETKYWLLTLLTVCILSSYPLYMGVRVIWAMIKDGTVSSADYPKYIIPYTPISLAVIIAVVLMPLLQKCVRKFAFLAASALSLGVFFTSELLLESKVIVTDTARTTLESWQMFMFYVSPERSPSRTWKAVDVLIGDYSPAFKIHFYLISVILIIALLNCLYGFGHMLHSGDRRRFKALVVQSICTTVFLSLCILACFTAFFRDGSLMVSPVSALLMGLFFIVFGVTAGVFAGSFLLGKKTLFSIWLPSVIASLITLFMYIGEMILLSANLYRFGSGILFDAIPGIVLAPIDILIILLSGVIHAGIATVLNRPLRSKGDASTLSNT